jgi:hypothetical protein
MYETCKIEVVRATSVLSAVWRPIVAIGGKSMRSLIVAAVLLWSAATAFAADPTGSYDVQGTNPDGSTYSGTATVTRTGQTYKVVWDVGGDTFTGTGIGNKDFLAISYAYDKGTGLVLLGADGGNWKGVWAYAGGTKVATEGWKRQ